MNVTIYQGDHTQRWFEVCTDRGGDVYGIFWDASLESSGDYYALFYANDTSDNIGMLNVTFTITAAVPPTIWSSWVTPDPLELGALLTLRCNARDSDGYIVEPIVANIYYQSNNTLVDSVNMDDNSTIGNYNWTATWDSSIVEAQFADLGFYVVYEVTDDDTETAFSPQNLFFWLD